MSCCHRIEIPAGVKLPGVTAQGCPTAVLPGQYLVHELPRKLLPGGRLLRIVGADASGGDVHVRPETIAPYLAAAQAGAELHRLPEAA